jgi:hypothetical protein
MWPLRVARCVDDGGGLGAEREAVAFRELEVDAGNLLRLGRRPGDPAAEALLQRQVAAGVIGVMVGDQDPVEPAAERLEPLRHRSVGARVDHGRNVRAGLAQEIAVVVAENRQELDLEGHRRFLRCRLLTLGLQIRWRMLIVQGRLTRWRMGCGQISSS